MASSYVFRTSDLPKLDLDIDRGTDFQAWHQQWLVYCSLSGLSAEPAAKQVQALQLRFSRETLNVVDNLGLHCKNKCVILAKYFTTQIDVKGFIQWELILNMAYYRTP